MNVLLYPGTMNAAYMFGFPEVQRACWDFAVGCVERHDNLSDIFRSAKLYAEHKMTRLLMRTVSRMLLGGQPDNIRRDQDMTQDAATVRETERARDRHTVKGTNLIQDIDIAKVSNATHN